jgi:hypothetical protein
MGCQVPEIARAVTLGTFVTHNGGMSRWLTRTRAEALVFGAWVLAVAAAMFLTDSTAAFMAILGGGFCAATVYQAAMRQWRAASRVLSLVAALSVNKLTAGSHSQAWHNAAFAVNLAAFAYFVVAGAVEKRASQRHPSKPGSERRG